MSAEATASPKSDKNVKIVMRDLFVNVFGQIRILKKIYPGIMHLLIFWGMTLLTIGHMVLLLQMPIFLPLELSFPSGNTYLVFETISDFAGIALLIGLLMAAIRRLILKPSYLESRWDDYYALIMLSLIPIMGYINEGIRITATTPTWATRSPVGNLFASWFQNLGLTAEQANGLHLPLVITHFVIGLLFLASIPYTKLRHLIVTPFNILFRERRKEGVLDTIEDIDHAEILGAGTIEEFETWQLISFDSCLRCGRCEDACPATAVGMDYSPRRMIQTLRDTMQGAFITPLSSNGTSKGNSDIFSEEYCWSCTTCGACIAKCPAFVNPVDQVIELRRYQVLMTGKIPKTVGETLRNMERQGNPWGLPPQERGKWAEGIDLPTAKLNKKTDVLLFFGCAMAFDERNKKIAQSITTLFNNMEISYATLGMDEGCCGETARRMGHEYIFQVMAEQNIELFKEIEFGKIVTPCPHCYNTIKNEYPKFGGKYEIQHITEFLSENGNSLINDENNGHKITYHDPCYLGRYNDVYDPPRTLLKNNFDNILEMKNNRKDSFCCGGGGGQMWLETDADTRINHQRLQHAVDTGAETIITACPYCLTMFEDAIGAKGLQDEIKVKDITETLAAERK
jgi:Fe-S oxidoreductase/nitrate reductase gamma subunit